MQNTERAKPSLSDYFQAVDRRLERQGLLPHTAVRIRLAGHLLEMRFPDRAIAQDALQYLAGQTVPLTEETPEATLFYWYHDPAACMTYLPAGVEDSSAIWQSRDDTGFLQITTDIASLLGGDLVRRRYYCARRAPTADTEFVNPTPMALFSRWADSSGLLLLHAAAVGAEGRGVLVVGRSGEGKSTFAVSCLLAGMDFVADDYTLLTASGPLEAMPLYDNIGLREDMYAQLQQSLGTPLTKDAIRWQPGKVRLPLPPERLTPSLPIRAILLPVLDGGEGEPFFTPATNGAFVRLLYSTARQLSRGKDADLIRRISERLGSLPVLEMHMSTDLTKNPEALRRAIIKKEI